MGCETQHTHMKKNVVDIKIFIFKPLGSRLKECDL